MLSKVYLKRGVMDIVGSTCLQEQPMKNDGKLGEGAGKQKRLAVSSWGFEGGKGGCLTEWN